MNSIQLLWLSSLMLMVAVCDGARVNLATTLECHVRELTFVASKPYRARGNVILPCYGNVTVRSCWGRCDSSEIADYKLPYRISYHPVCSYGGRSQRYARLQKCHPDHPDNTYEVFDATYCVCQTCNADHTSCENLRS